MHPSVVPLAAIFRLNTELLLNCVDGVPEAEMSTAPAGQCNHMAFLTAHLIQARHLALSLIGDSTPNPLKSYLEGARSQAEVAQLPPTGELLALWEATAARLAVAIERLDTPALAREVRRFPGTDGTLLGTLTFLSQHDSYHLGQLALLRRQLGFPAMSYSLRPREPGRLGA